MRILSPDGVVRTYCDKCGDEVLGWMVAVAHSSNTAPANLPEYLDFWCGECVRALIKPKGNEEWPD